MISDRVVFAAFLIPFAVTIAIMPSAIAYLRQLRAGQTIQEDAPKSHQPKSGTPTMGGLVILISVAVSCTFLFSHVGRPYIDDPRYVMNFFAVSLLVAAYAVIGFADDWLTIHPRDRVRGLSSKVKFLLQFLAAVAFVVYLGRIGTLDTHLRVGHLVRLDLGWVYPPLAVLILAGMANFVNITDGLDGLAAGLVIPVPLVMAATMPPIDTMDANPQLVLALLGLAGACVGFLWFNFNPARVFMGDTGSLAIGAAIPAIAIVTKTEIPMIIAGMVFILDGLSSALQWAVFKYTRIRTGTGRRVFKMSPVHHHFELSGWPEQLVVVRFWIVGGLCALLAFLLEFWR